MSESPRPEGGGAPPVWLMPVSGFVAPGVPEHPARWNRPAARLLVVAGGRDGMGKSTLAANLALALGERGARVVLVDGDLGRAHLDLLLGVHPRWDVSDLLSGECTLEEVLVPAGRNVRLVAAASGSPELGRLDDFRRELLLRSLGHLDASTDWIVLDTASRDHEQTLAFCRAARQVLVVCTPETPALGDAYAFLKQLQQDGLAHTSHLVMNMVAGAEEAAAATQHLSAFARRFLQVEFDLLAAIPDDAAVPRSIRLQEPALLAFPDSHAARAYRELAARMWKPAPDDPPNVVAVDQPQRLEA